MVILNSSYALNGTAVCLQGERKEIKITKGMQIERWMEKENERTMTTRESGGKKKRNKRLQIGKEEESNERELD